MAECRLAADFACLVDGHDATELAPVDFLDLLNRIPESKYTAVAKGKSVDIFNASGKPAGSIILSDSARRVEIGGSFIYLLTSRGVSIHGVNANTQLLIPEMETTETEDPVIAATSPVERPPAAVTEQIAQTTLPIITDSFAEG